MGGEERGRMWEGGGGGGDGELQLSLVRWGAGVERVGPSPKTTPT